MLHACSSINSWRYESEAAILRRDRDKSASNREFPCATYDRTSPRPAIDRRDFLPLKAWELGLDLVDGN